MKYTFWDAKNLYFKRLEQRELAAQQKANLRLLEALLDQAYIAGAQDAQKKEHNRVDIPRIIL